MKHLYLITIVLLYSITAAGQAWPLTAKLESTDKQTDDNNAYSVEIVGNLAVTGAYHHDLDGSGGNSMNNAGAAYVYEYDTATKTWTQQAKLLAADRSATALFGYDVAIFGSYIVVGAPQDSSSCGAAYVYERGTGGTWSQVKKLVATSRRASDRFGTSVAISGDWILVGAHHEDEDVNDMNALNNCGSAFFFYRNGGGWDSVQKVVASDRSVNSEFGIDVGMDGFRAIVGSYRHDNDTVGIEKGAAYAFSFNGSAWVQSKQLEASDRMRDDEFGWSVDVSGSYFIVGSPKNDLDESGSNAMINTGAVYIYDETNSWAESKLVSSDRADQDNFGQSVSIAGDRAVGGAPNQNFGPIGQSPPVLRSNAGAAYVLKRATSGTWSQEKKLVTDDTDRFGDDKLGWSVAIDGDKVIAGAPENNLDSTAPKASIGTAYVFDKDSAASVYKYAKVNGMHMYPNPTGNVTYLDFEQEVRDVFITVYNTSGQMIFHKHYMHTKRVQVDVSAQPAGMYMFDILVDGQQYKGRMLVKE